MDAETMNEMAKNVQLIAGLMEKAASTNHKLGRVGMQLEVHGWMVRHAQELSMEAMRDLYTVLEMEP